MGIVLQALLLAAFLLSFQNHLLGAETQQPRGWRFGVAAWSFNRYSLYEAIEKTSALGLHYLEAYEGQIVHQDGNVKMGADLSEEVIREIKAQLQAAGVTLTSIYIHELPQEERACRKAFMLCRKLGLKTIISEPSPESLNLIERLCDEYRINVAIHNHAEGKSRYWHPREILRVVEGRSPRLGACADIGHWQRSGLSTTEGIRLLGSRLISIHVKDLDQATPEGHDVPWGTGKGEVGEVLRTIHRLGVVPTLITVEYEYNWENNSPEIAKCHEFYRQMAAELEAAEPPKPPLYAGWASVDITPPQPVALVGQLHKRISTGTRDPLTATILSLETRDAQGQKEQAILVSCDVLFIPSTIQARLQETIRSQLPDFEATKLFLNATHTHTGPGFDDKTFGDLYDVSKDPGVMKASEYADYFLQRLTPAVVESWKARQPSSLGWAVTHAVVGWNRRAHYLDGSSVMYGSTSQPEFRSLEAGMDPAVGLLCFWGPDSKLLGLVINLHCTAQETEQLYEISADFWHDTRWALRSKLGKDLFILPQCAPAGDLSPHLVYRKEAQAQMVQRRQLSPRKEIAQRLTQAIQEALPLAESARADRLLFRHTVARIELPEHTPPAMPFYLTDSVKPVEIHVLRLGDVALATNPFELYLDYGLQIEAKSQAALTMLVQLSGANCGYLPTEKAVKGGGYSADKFVVGPVGGQVLVEETVKEINRLFP